MILEFISAYSSAYDMMIFNLFQPIIQLVTCQSLLDHASLLLRGSTTTKPVGSASSLFTVDAEAT